MVCDTKSSLPGEPAVSRPGINVAFRQVRDGDVDEPALTTKATRQPAHGGAGNPLVDTWARQATLSP